MDTTCSEKWCLNALELFYKVLNVTGPAKIGHVHGHKNTITGHISALE